MPPNWKNRLEPFGELYLDIYKRIVEMTDDELHNLINACDKPSETNCGWHIYVIAPLVKKEAQEEMAYRTYIRAKAHSQKCNGATVKP